MKFDTLGDKKNPAVVLVHGMFCNADGVKHFARYLQDEYYVVIPTLTGHHPGPESYGGKEADARKMLAYLHEEGIEELAMLQGTSMGAEVALELARIVDIPVRRYFFDGGPFFQFPWLMKKLMYKKFQGLVRTCRGKSGDEAFDAIMENGFVRWLVGKNKEVYRPMMKEFVTVARDVTDATVANVVETCYNCPLPSFPEETQKKFLFFYVEKEPAHKARKRLEKAYPHARFETVSGVGHGGLQAARPEEYAAYLKKSMME